MDDLLPEMRANYVAVPIGPSPSPPPPPTLKRTTGLSKVMPVTSGSPISGVYRPGASTEPKPAGPPKPPVAPSHRILGKGSYGAVFEPALLNRNASGKWREFPGEVTKAFYGPDDKAKALDSQRKAQVLMGYNRGHAIENYSYPYKLSNIPPTSNLYQTILATWKAGDPAPVASKPNSKYMDLPLSIVRMPTLGVSVETALYDNIDLSTVPVLEFFRQVEKVMHQVVLLKGAGMIHGDIRHTNVMIEPRTGQLTIIDFDWLKEKGDFFAKYGKHLGFTSNPPESFVSLLMDIGKTSDSFPSSIALQMFIQSPDKTVEKINQRLRTWITQANKYGWAQKLSGRPLSKLELVDVVFGALRSTPSRDALYDQMFETFDSFGLATTLLNLVAMVFPSLNHITLGARHSAFEPEILADAVNRLNGILRRCASLVPMGRMTPESALDEIRKIVANLGGGAAGGRRHYSRKRKYSIRKRRSATRKNHYK